MAVQYLIAKCTFIIYISVSSVSGLDTSKIKPEIKIVGGNQARIAQFPHQVSIRSASGFGSTLGHFCGGSILNDRHILTAAHCLYRREPWDLYIVAGVLKLSDAGQQRKVQSFSLYSLYTDYSFKYDVGVLTLYTPLDINNYTVKKIPLQLTTPPPGTLCTVSGWGQVQEDNVTIPNTLRYVDIPIADWVSCVRNYSKVGNTVPETGMLCAGLPSGGKDACSGDSGGPLVCGDQLTGVVSWGAGCAERYLPGVYTDVSYYNQWIMAHSGSIITIEYRGLAAFVVLGYICLYLIKVG